MAAKWRPYTSGSFKGLFDGATTTAREGHLVVYAIKDLPDELKPVGTLLTLDAIWRKVSSSSPDLGKLVLVGEAWLMLRAGLGAKFLFRLSKSARKYGAGLTVVTQVCVGGLQAVAAVRVTCRPSASSCWMRWRLRLSTWLRSLYRAALKFGGLPPQPLLDPRPGTVLFPASEPVVAGLRRAVPVRDLIAFRPRSRSATESR